MARAIVKGIGVVRTTFSNIRGGELVTDGTVLA